MRISHVFTHLGIIKRGHQQFSHYYFVLGAYACRAEANLPSDVRVNRKRSHYSQIIIKAYFLFCLFPFSCSIILSFRIDQVLMPIPQFVKCLEVRRNRIRGTKCIRRRHRKIVLIVTFKCPSWIFCQGGLKIVRNVVVVMTMNEAAPSVDQFLFRPNIDNLKLLCGSFCRR
jgi:hypothetical protein